MDTEQVNQLAIGELPLTRLQIKAEVPAEVPGVWYRSAERLSIRSSRATLFTDSVSKDGKELTPLSINLQLGSNETACEII